ncbi:MAG: S8 family serine peptidase [Eggerthellaceae bacterium]|nr:S8 family serine peptidase [Eggerthellaceae bacterium]
MRKKTLASLLTCALVAGMIPFAQGIPQAQAAEDEILLTVDSDGGDVGGASGEEEFDAGAGSFPESTDGILGDAEEGIEEGTPSPTEEDWEEAKLQVLSVFEENLDVEYVEGEVIVVFKDAIEIEEVFDVLQEVEAVDEESLTEESLIGEDAVVVELEDETSIYDALVELNNNPDIAYAQPNYLYRLLEGSYESQAEPSILDVQEGVFPLATTINDTYRSSQWHLSTIRAYDAWSLTRANGRTPSIGVAVIDTGVRTDHEDLQNVIIPGSYYDTTGRGQTTDTHGHGTQVAGIVAAEANNGKGIAGVSYNARIVPICVYYQSAGGYASSTAELSKAYSYLFSVGSTGKTRAVEYNVKVINISSGSTAADPSLKAWIDTAYNAGVLTVSAAGNGGIDPGYKQTDPIYPGSFDKCINVSALKQGTGVLNDVFDAYYSNYGSTVNLSAPGTYIWTTTRGSASSYSGLGYGTSFAAPIVSGVAALVFAANPSVTPAQVRDALEKTAVDLGTKGWDQYYGWGEVNPYEAAKYVAVTTIANTASAGMGKPITCAVTSTLPMATTWQWSVVSGPGTITSAGVLTPTKDDSIIRVRATYTGDSTVYVEKDIVIPKALELSYSTHVQTVGWQSAAKDGEVSGTSGRGLRLEGLKINLINTTGYAGGISYSTHIQSIGWQAPATVTTTGVSGAEAKGSLSGTEGRALRLEAIKMSLTGQLANYYDIYYRVHAQNVGWMGWAKGGKDSIASAEEAGTAGHSFRLEALQIVLVAKGGGAAPANNYKSVATVAGTPRMIDPAAGLRGAVSYNAMMHIQSIGDTNFNGSNGSNILGTTGRALRVEAMTLSLPNKPTTGGIEYSVHVQNIGWLPKVGEGGFAGTRGMSYRLEALQISLTGNLATQYDVYYRTHIQSIGWTGWAKSGQPGQPGQSCGSAGYGYRMEAMQIVIVPKGGVAPGLNANYFYQR